MLEELILTKLQEMGKPVVRTGDEWIMTTCLNPKHPDTKPSFHINTKSGSGSCFACGFKVGREYWVNGKLDEEDIEALARAAQYEKLKKQLQERDIQGDPEIFLPPRSEELEEGWRGLSEETIKRLDLYICRKGVYKDRVIFPIKNTFGDVIAFNSRALTNEITPKYKYSKGIKVNDIVYPLPMPQCDYTVLVEGVMDAIHLQQAGINSMFNFGVNYTFSNSKIATLLRSGIDTIYLMFDNDKAGLRATAEYLSSPLSDFFSIKLATELDELDEFFKSGCKDYAEFAEKKIKEQNEMAYLNSIYVDGRC